MPRKVLTKSPLPTNNSWSWYERYFDVGETVEYVEYRNLNRGKKVSGKIAKIKVNQYRRVSYQLVNGREIMLEDIVRGFGKVAVVKGDHAVVKVKCDCL